MEYFRNPLALPFAAVFPYPLNMSGRQTTAFATIYRCLGWIYMAGLAYWLLSGSYKGLPLWAVVCLLAGSILLIRRSFKISQRFSPRPTDDQPTRLN